MNHEGIGALRPACRTVKGEEALRTEASSSLVRYDELGVSTLYARLREAVGLGLVNPSRLAADCNRWCEGWAVWWPPFGWLQLLSHGRRLAAP